MGSEMCIRDSYSTGRSQQSCSVLARRDRFRVTFAAYSVLSVNLPTIDDQDFFLVEIGARLGIVPRHTDNCSCVWP